MKCPGVCLRPQNGPILKDSFQFKKNISLLMRSSAHFIPILRCNIRLKMHYSRTLFTVHYFVFVWYCLTLIVAHSQHFSS